MNKDELICQAFLEKLAKYIELLEFEKLEEKILDDYKCLFQRGILTLDTFDFDNKTKIIKTMKEIKEHIKQRKNDYPNYKDYQIKRDEIITHFYNYSIDKTINAIKAIELEQKR